MVNSHLMTNKYKPSHAELLDLTNVISPHQQCLSSLMTGVYKCLNGLLPDLVNSVLTVSKHQYNIRNNDLLVTDGHKIGRYAQNSDRL